MSFKINDNCVGCGSCVSECVVDCISCKDDGRFTIDKDQCVGCGACEKVCPVGAIFED